MAWTMWLALGSLRARTRSSTNQDEMRPVAMMPQRVVGRGEGGMLVGFLLGEGGREIEVRGIRKNTMSK